MNRLKYGIGAAYLRVMHGLSRVGEAVGWEWLVYNPLVHYSFARAARRNAPPLVEGVRAIFPDVKSVCDVGCGPGVFAAAFQDGGYRVVACEYSARLRSKTAARGVKVVEFDLSKAESPLPPGVPCDLSMSLEVAEHIPASFADRLVSYVADCGRVVLFTAAHPGQGGTGHINEQPQSYWIEKFRAIGLVHRSGLSEDLGKRLREAGALPFMYENMMIFSRE